VYVQGTPTTIALFVALIAIKFVLGLYEYLHHIDSRGGAGEVMMMTALMLGFQAELVWHRAQALMVTPNLVRTL
jgi:hypothetical protein